jgi:hypothetical protein
MSTPKLPIPPLHTYRNQGSTMQMAINQFLISYVREDGYFNITMIGTTRTYNLVKLKNVNFGYATVDVVFKTITGEIIDLPIDLLESIEFAGQKEV